MNFPPVEQEFCGKVAFILGGSSGLGLAAAKILAERGASVTIFGHGPDTLEIATTLTSTGLKVRGMHGDGTQSQTITAAIEETVSQFGGSTSWSTLRPSIRLVTWLQPTKRLGIERWQST